VYSPLGRAEMGIQIKRDRSRRTTTKNIEGEGGMKEGEGTMNLQLSYL